MNDDPTALVRVWVVEWKVVRKPQGAARLTNAKSVHSVEVAPLSCPRREGVREPSEKVSDRRRVFATGKAVQ